VSDDVVFRRAEARDVPEMARLAGQLVRMHHAADPSRFFLVDEVEKGYAWWFGREIARAAGVAIVASQADHVVGYAYGTLEERDWNMLLDEHGALHDVFVDQAFRGRGVGRRLVEEAVAALQRLGAPRVVLSTMFSNEQAQRLFRRCGFRPTMIEMTRDAETVTSPKNG
jgi:ribosomal protein S18 acetylase RimI-like enzyme